MLNNLSSPALERLSIRRAIRQDMESLGKRIAAAREAAGLTPSGLSRLIGVSRAAVAQWESDDTKPSAENLQKLAKTIGLTLEPTPNVMGNTGRALQAMPVAGQVQASAWLEIDDDVWAPTEFIPVLENPAYRRARQFALKVVGTSMNKVVQPGEFVIVASWPDLGTELRDGELVVVRRERAMTYEVTLKRARWNGKGWELWPESTDPRYQEPVRMDDGDRDVEVSIVGKVIGRYSDM